MKISALQNYNYNKIQFNSQFKRGSNENYQNSPINKVATMPQYSYPIINFTGDSDFKRTVEVNYFKLPKNAKPDVFQLAAAQNIFLDY